MKIYLDLAIFLNFLVDFLLLLGTNRLSGFPPGWRNAAAAATLGACYAGFCIPFRFLGSMLWRTLMLGLMGVVAFGWNRSAWRRTAVFVILATALGGMAMGLRSHSFGALVLAAGGVWILCRVAFEGAAGTQEYIPVTLSYGGRTLRVVALRDTGNTLTDPLTGEPVLILSPHCAEALTGLTQAQLQHPAESLRALPGLRLIPYCSVGNGTGLMLALRFHGAVIGSETRDALIAFAPEGLGKTTMYQALTGGV